jgi:hypothetical protein
MAPLKVQYFPGNNTCSNPVGGRRQNARVSPFELRDSAKSLDLPELEITLEEKGQLERFEAGYRRFSIKNGPSGSQSVPKI